MTLHPDLPPTRAARAAMAARMARHGATIDSIMAKAGVAEDEAAEAIAAAGRTTPATLTIVCHRSGRTWSARSARGAYLRAQILGLTDWGLYGATEGKPR